MTQRISDYALLGDCQSAALVGRDGSIDWWCAPRFDSRSVFARLLDPAAGHWVIAPSEVFDVQREYLSDTMVLRTDFRTAGGTLRLTDALALEPGARGHEIGQRSPHAVVRLAEVIDGEVEVMTEFAPRLEYGLITPALRSTEGGLETVGGPDALRLLGDRPLDVDEGTASAVFRLRAGESAAFVAHHQAGSRSPVETRIDPRQAIADAVDGWRSWSEAHTGYQGAHRDAVRRSALVLQALTYQPSGAVVAAPTTSLPEEAGGELNWDYRYAWLRDAGLTLRALWVAACPDEAKHYFDWMARACVGSDAHVQIVFGVEGERDLSERELDHLSGYRGSRPVRVGNGAWQQKQLDVYGEVLDAAWMLREGLGELDSFTASFLCGLADRAANSWTEPDAGIWEARDAERHYTTSKLFCWVALDRALELGDLLGPDAAPQRWSEARDEIRQAILLEAWSETVGAYTGAFGSEELDAGVLLMPIMGFLPANDERMRRTIDEIERVLGEGGLVHRWADVGEEGSFVICSYWLANCLALAGEVDRAQEVFASVSAHANDVGLLSEEIDRRDGELLGNFPQAFSHVGLINAAWSIDRAVRKQSSPGPGGS